MFLRVDIVTKCLTPYDRVANGIPDIFCLLFVDCAYTAVNLQKQLNTIDKCCTETDMVVNLKKYEIIVFRNGGPLREYKRWVYRGEHIKVTSTYKFMGLLFTPKLSWHSVTTKLPAQARKSLYQVKQFEKTFW